MAIGEPIVTTQQITTPYAGTETTGSAETPKNKLTHLNNGAKSEQSTWMWQISITSPTDDSSHYFPLAFKISLCSFSFILHKQERMSVALLYLYILFAGCFIVS